MENWKVKCVEDWIMTGGDSGRINFYDSISKERVKKVSTGEIFLTALARANERGFVASGNNCGDVYIVNNVTGKERTANFKPHSKLVRDLAFVEDDTKLLTASDDWSIKMIDVSSEKVVQTFEGHKLGVTSISVHQSDPRVFFSTSFDKNIKIWDLRTKECVGTAVTGSALWSCRSVGKNLLAGGDSKVLYVYSVE
jgi:WD40 repeat protein